MVHLYWILLDGTRENNAPQLFSSFKGAWNAAETFFAKTSSPYLRADIVDPHTASIIGTVKNRLVEHPDPPTSI
jgi:hypothetical protein